MDNQVNDKHLTQNQTLGLLNGILSSTSTNNNGARDNHAAASGNSEDAQFVRFIFMDFTVRRIENQMRAIHEDRATDANKFFQVWDMATPDWKQCFHGQAFHAKYMAQARETQTTVRALQMECDRAKTERTQLFKLFSTSTHGQGGTSTAPDLKCD